MPDRLKRYLHGGRLLFIAAAALGAVLVGASVATGLYIEILWFEAVDYLSVFWTRTLWNWALRIVAGALTAGVIFLNLRVVASTLGAIQVKRRVGDLEISEKLPRSYVTWALAGMSALVAFWFGAAVPADAGTRTLLFLNAPEWGMVEPILGRDASFYVFALPLLSGAVTFAMVLTFLTGALAAAGYSATGSLGWDEKGLVLDRTARVHLGALVGAFLLVLAARFWVGRYALLLDGTSPVQGIFGHADAEARLPAYTALAVVTVVAAGGVVWGAARNRAIPLLASLGAVLVGGIVLVQLYPSFVQRFRVEPNELARESPYIEHNLEFTRMGFGLDRLQENPFGYERPDDVDWEEAREQTSGFPIWSENVLLTTYREIEARFRYYTFSSVAVDRYWSLDGMEPVSISLREIDPGGIEDPNWQNLHVRRRYITGMGAVVTAAVRVTSEGRPEMLVSGIPPVVSEGPQVPPELAVERPSVYFGSRPQLYAILNAGEGVFEDPDGNPGAPGVDFPPGIRTSSLVRTLALAWRFRDANLLFASEVTDSSRFVFRRQVQERVQTIAPFLRYESDPYPVISEGRIFWMLDAFTGARSFPLASSQQAGLRRSLSYIRNSVKITMDAVTGETHFYVVREDDPLVEAYRRIFPDLFRPLEEMPSSLRRHIRYPQSLLDLQANVLRQYHQKTPARFHGQQDVWDRPQELGRDSRPVPYGSEYAYFRLPGEDEPEFLVSTVFVPVGRQNLTGILVARSDPERYGELLLLDVAVDEQVQGPRQVEALVEQDPTISEQFSLWRTGGSQVWTGHLHLIPVGNTLLYMEPIYLAAEADAIPELRRFVVSDGNRVIMARTMDEALTALSEGRTPGAVVEAGREAEEPSTGMAGSTLSPRALELLNRAEERLQDGDWAGFGEALEELRDVLERSRSDTTAIPETGSPGGGPLP